MTSLYAYYLPQFHEIKENSLWWGEGFTEWVNLRKARPLYNGHIQPDYPLDKYYYDLDNPATLKKQVEWAKSSGIEGFVYYHYWFEGRQLLEKPAERFLRNKDIAHGLIFMWANHDWTRSWTGGKETLIKQNYGQKNEWVNHIKYLIEFFKDERYKKIRNKPVLEIYQHEHIECLEEMMAVWNQVLKENGFDGIYLVAHLEQFNENELISNLFSAITYQEHSTGLNYYYRHEGIIKKIVRYIVKRCKYRHLLLNKGPRIANYDDVIKGSIEYLKTINNPQKDIIPQVCTGWDNTPRYGERGYVIENACPDKFESFLSSVCDHAERLNSPLIFLACWNEWCEGLVLEPSEKFGYGYLQAVKNIYKLKIENNENHKIY